MAKRTKKLPKAWKIPAPVRHFTNFLLCHASAGPFIMATIRADDPTGYRMVPQPIPDEPIFKGLEDVFEPAPL